MEAAAIAGWSACRVEFHWRGLYRLSEQLWQQRSITLSLCHSGRGGTLEKYSLNRLSFGPETRWTFSFHKLSVQVSVR